MHLVSYILSLIVGHLNTQIQQSVPSACGELDQSQAVGTQSQNGSRTWAYQWTMGLKDLYLSSALWCTFEWQMTLLDCTTENSTKGHTFAIYNMSHSILTNSSNQKFSPLNLRRKERFSPLLLAQTQNRHLKIMASKSVYFCTYEQRAQLQSPKSDQVTFITKTAGKKPVILALNGLKPVI